PIRCWRRCRLGSPDRYGPATRSTWIWLNPTRRPFTSPYAAETTNKCSRPARRPSESDCTAMVPGWQPLLDRIAAERNPKTKANMQIVARHVVEEVAGNMPALMATLVPDPQYSVWGASDSTGPSGYDAVVDWYHRLQAGGRNRLDYVIHRVV